MNDGTLLDLCKTGDRTAMDKLFTDYVQAVYRWAVSFGADKTGAEDITQEVFRNAFNRISDCKSQEHLPSWLFQITRRVCANYRRNVWVKRVFGFESRDNKPIESHYPELTTRDFSELSIEIKQCLEKIPMKYLDALILHDIEGYTREEIKDMLGIPAGTVAYRIFKAREMFINKWEAN